MRTPWLDFGSTVLERSELTRRSLCLLSARRDGRGDEIRSQRYRHFLPSGSWKRTLKPPAHYYLSTSSYVSSSFFLHFRFEFEAHFFFLSPPPLAVPLPPTPSPSAPTSSTRSRRPVSGKPTSTILLSSSSERGRSIDADSSTTSSESSTRSSLALRVVSDASFSVSNRQDWHYLRHYARAHSLAAFKTTDFDQIVGFSEISLHIARESQMHVQGSPFVTTWSSCDANTIFPLSPVTVLRDLWNLERGSPCDSRNPLDVCLRSVHRSSLPFTPKASPS